MLFKMLLKKLALGLTGAVLTAAAWRVGVDVQRPKWDAGAQITLEDVILSNGACQHGMQRASAEALQEAAPTATKERLANHATRNNTVWSWDLYGSPAHPGF